MLPDFSSALTGFPHRVVLSDPMEGISSRLHLAMFIASYQSLSDRLVFHFMVYTALVPSTDGGFFIELCKFFLLQG